MNRMNEQELPNLQGVGHRLTADVASHFPMGFFAWSFPQTVSIVVSRILRVFGSSGHNWQQEHTKQTRHQRWCAGRLFDV